MKLNAYDAIKQSVELTEDEVASIVQSEILLMDIKELPDGGSMIDLRQFIIDACLKPSNGFDTIRELYHGNWKSIREWIIKNSTVCYMHGVYMFISVFFAFVCVQSFVSTEVYTAPQQSLILSGAIINAIFVIAFFAKIYKDVLNDI